MVRAWPQARSSCVFDYAPDGRRASDRGHAAHDGAARGDAGVGAVMDEAGMDTIRLAEAYPWWRKARDGGALVHGGLHPHGARDEAADDRSDHLVVHAAPGAGGDGCAGRAGGRRSWFLLGFGRRRSSSTTFVPKRRRRWGRCATRSRSCGARRRRVRVRGRHLERLRAGLQDAAETPREVPPVYVAATAPKMQALSGEIADGCLTPSITTPAFVRATRART